MSNEIKTGDPATEWRRSNPDIVVYLPKEPGLDDGDNEHFLVFESPGGKELLAMWNQSSCEGRGDNHIVIARSSDGETWSDQSLSSVRDHAQTISRQAGEFRWFQSRGEFTVFTLRNFLS